jgi:hypothetical protein
MRLLKIKTTNYVCFYIDLDFEFTEDFTDLNNTPGYAILSHRWGCKDEEVSFADMNNRTAKTKHAGYEKLIFCALQAKRHNLDYIWVDTCCHI